MAKVSNNVQLIILKSLTITGTMSDSIF